MLPLQTIYRSSNATTGWWSATKRAQSLRLSIRPILHRAARARVRSSTSSWSVRGRPRGRRGSGSRRTVTSAITPAHCRAARGLLDWTLKRLSVRSGISNSALRDFERDRPVLSDAALCTLRAAFEAEGVQFRHVDNRRRDSVSGFFRSRSSHQTPHPVPEWSSLIR